MWEIIKANRQRSFFLFVLMGLVLLGLGYVAGYAYGAEQGGIVGLGIAGGLFIIMSLVSITSAPRIMLSVSNAKEIKPDVHPQLYNVVEEMKLAANLPAMPKIYIINEEAPNAFATGLNPKNSAIAVTAGLLARLNRDELQGVVAHEMAHIINRDVRFITLAGIMMGVIVMMSEVFLRSMWYSGGARYGSSKDKGQGQVIIMVVAIVLSILAPILAQVLYFSISRKREYLADASAARLTRYPEGLASALEKISNNTTELKAANKVTAPMYIANPLKPKGQKLSNLTSTHPPIQERIKILRTMAGGAAYANYQEAWSSVKGGSSQIIPPSSLGLAENVEIRPPATDTTTQRSVKRKTGDIMMQNNEYQFIQCKCGVKLKIPPDFRHERLNCPKCGRVHHLNPSV
jgi:heat shock protein HtpX